VLFQQDGTRGDAGVNDQVNLRRLPRGWHHRGFTATCVCSMLTAIA
jgi:hypothetical protein